MKLALVFPGQGSQTKGMLSDLCEKYPQVKNYFAQASEVLGYDLWDVIQNDADKLGQTEVTQPALLVSSYAIYQLIKQTYPDLEVSFMAGHSLGEYSALAAAGILDFKDAVKLVQKRGNAMTNAVPNGGAMYAIIGLDDQSIIEACNKASEQTNQVVSAVNFNSPGQVVIAGTKEATEVAANSCKELGAKRALLLPVSVPSHCALMQPAADVMKVELENTKFNPAQVSVVHNTDLSVSQTSEEFQDKLIRQLVGPVLWSQTIEKLVNQDKVTHFVEVGPGKVLTGLIGRIIKDAKVMEVNNPDTLEKLAEFLN